MYLTDVRIIIQGLINVCHIERSEILFLNCTGFQKSLIIFWGRRKLNRKNQTQNQWSFTYFTLKKTKYNLSSLGYTL